MKEGVQEVRKTTVIVPTKESKRPTKMFQGYDYETQKRSVK